MARRSIRVFAVVGIMLFLSFKTIPFAQQSGAVGTSAAVPRLVAFGGVLRDGKGQALSGVVGVTFSMYKDQHGGAPLWTENQNVQFDEQGRYSVLLGGTQGTGLPVDLFTSTEQRWLGVQAQLPGETEQPRVLLVSVPYALKAVDADTIGGKPASAFVLAPDSLNNADTITPTPKSTTKALPNAQTPLAPSGSGTTGKVTKWIDGPSGTLGDSVLIENNGRIGLGNATPQTTLDVIGTIRVAPFGAYMMPNGGPNNSFRFGFGNNLVFDGTNWTTEGDGVHNAGSGIITDITSGSLQMYTLPSTGGAGQVIGNNSFNAFEKMRLTAAGNLGLGTTNPQAKLDLGSSGDIRLGFDSAGANRVLKTYTTGHASGNVPSQLEAGIQDGGGTSGMIVKNFRDGGFNSQQVEFATSHGGVSLGTRMTIDKDGNIGIGTNTPGAKLDVAGDLNVSGNIINGSGSLSLPNTSSATSGVLTIGGTPFLHDFGASGNTAANTFVGQSSGNFSMLGVATGNTATGAGTLNSLTTGGDNTAIGAFALNANTRGNSNIGIGASALTVNTVGAFNIAIGESALSSNTTGSFNTAVGDFAGFNGTLGGTANTTGSTNTFIGALAGSGTPTQLNNATAIGANALVSASNTLVLGASGVSVAIGASTAATKLQVVGDIRVGTSGTNGCIQGFGGAPLAGTCSSDLRLKQNIEPFAPVLDKLTQLQPVSYDWRADEHPEYHFGNERTSGLIAQEVEKVFPNMVAVDERGYKAVNYSELPLLLLQAMRELKAENDATVHRQQSQIHELLLEVEALKARLEPPESSR